MQKKIWILIGIIIIILIGGASVFFNQKEHEQQRNERQILRMEKKIAKQIKNTFVDVQKIEFIPEMSGVYNEKTGFWHFSSNITTQNGTKDTGNIIYKDNEGKLTSFGPIDSDFRDIIKSGMTSTPVKVIYSDKSEGEI
ncbi:hypothetical protein JZO73_15320 [Enterococcus plantarum]|uniref:hypothetical protein n=1 Tax=Enterococcus plantarum TaxID=1077675 RepID=UPI001A8CA15A|nr:hypothetical protein [Enterococcus plantarum]MBO0468870.1 hypothetical protein [Enterococcus plantarum]